MLYDDVATLASTEYFKLDSDSRFIRIDTYKAELYLAPDGFET